MARPAGGVAEARAGPDPDSQRPPCRAGRVGLCDLELPSVLAVSSSVTCEVRVFISRARTPEAHWSGLTWRPLLRMNLDTCTGTARMIRLHLREPSGCAPAPRELRDCRRRGTPGRHVPEGGAGLPGAHTIGLSLRLPGLRGRSGGATGSQPSPVQRGSHRGSLG